MKKFVGSPPNTAVMRETNKLDNRVVLLFARRPADKDRDLQCRGNDDGDDPGPAAA